MAGEFEQREHATDCGPRCSGRCVLVPREQHVGEFGDRLRFRLGQRVGLRFNFRPWQLQRRIFIGSDGQGRQQNDPAERPQACGASGSRLHCQRRIFGYDGPQAGGCGARRGGTRALKGAAPLTRLALLVRPSRPRLRSKR